MSHTPGPWRFETRNCSEPNEEPTMVGYIHAPEREVAVLYGDDSRAENGALIAAAPDMLVALKRAEQAIHSEYCSVRCHSECVAVAAAIAKAEAARDAD